MVHSFRELSVYIGKRAPYMLARKGVQIAMGLAVFAVLTRVLSKEEFAVYNLVFGVIAMVRFTALPGIGSALAQAFARGHMGGFGRAVRFSFFGAFLGAAGLAGAGWWHQQNDQTLAGSALLLAAVCLPPMIGLTYWRHAAAGSERYARLMLFDSLTALTHAVFVISCAYLIAADTLVLVVAAMLAPAAVNVVAIVLEARRVPPDAETERRMIPYGLRVSVYELPTLLALQADKLVLFYLISPEAMAVYVVAAKMPLLLQTIFGEANATLGPLFARQSAYTRELHGFSLRLSLIYLAFAIVIAFTAVPFLLPLLAGEAYADAIPYAQAMTVGAALGTLGNIQFRYIKSRLDSRSFLHITLLRSVVDVTLIAVLTYLFGFEGVVSAFVLKGAASSLLTGLVFDRTHGHRTSQRQGS